MNVVLWIVQAFLAVAFLVTGFAHATGPRDQLAKRMTWVSAVPPAFLRFIGVSELLGAIGLVLPLATGILPGLTVAAAGGLAFVMLSAIVLHLTRREYATLVANVVLLVLALFAAYGRVAMVRV
jgi:putative oxidoreductase